MIKAPMALEEFCRIIKVIQDHENDCKVLTKIMLKSSVGIIDYGFDVVAELVKLLERIFDDKDENISWWLYEDVDKVFVYKDRDYDIDVRTPESLYYYLIGKEELCVKTRKYKRNGENECN